MSKTSTNHDIINHIYKELEESTESKLFNTNTLTKLELSLCKEEIEAILEEVSRIELMPSNVVIDRILNYSISKKMCN
tara:strand:- start:64 stop:297 length:234 start_codon:yes stop_codon:yes gene_type:complete